MLQAGQPYPIILNSLNLVVCIRGSLPEIKLANTTKNLILNQFLQDQSKLTEVKSIGFEESPVKLPNTLLASFKDLKESLIKAKTEGSAVVFIKSLQDIKLDSGSFSENMNKIVNELIDLSKTFELTLVVGVDITKLENVPPYALNKKANLWIIEDRDQKTLINHNKSKVVYNVDFDPHSGISFEFNNKPEIIIDNEKEIIDIKKELDILTGELQGLFFSDVVLENLTQISKKVYKLSETLLHKIRQQIKIKDLIEKGYLSVEDSLVLSYKGQIQSLEIVLEDGEALLKDKSGATYKTPSGAASSITGRNANGWHELQVLDKNGLSKGDLIGIREMLVQKKTTYKFSKITTPAKKTLSISEKVILIFEKSENKGKFLDYLEVYSEINKYYPGSVKGQTPELTISSALSTLAKEGRIKVAKPSGGKSKYYV